MKHVERSPRPYFALPEPLQQRLNSYALAAGAAGIGMLAVAQPTEAKIVYTPAHKVIGLNNKVALDLNHDGKSDFTFQESFFTTTSVGEAHSLKLSVVPTHKNEILGTKHHASALAAGVQVGPKGPFSSAKKTMAVDYYADGTGGSGTCAGLWNNVKNRYLGLKFSINGKTHFGWARLTVTCTTTFESHQVTGLLTGYAYETVPNKAIITGKTKGPDDETSREQPGSAALTTPTPNPPTLGMLAMGLPGLSIWRREESANPTSKWTESIGV
jgi:hypothetical protein